MSVSLPLKNDVGVSDSSVQSYFAILQAVIARMAANSSAAKTWCITIVSAVVVVIADKGKPELVIIAAIPVFLFLLLDAYYLSLEKHFRDTFNDFLGKLHRGEARGDDLFLVAGPKGVWLPTKGIMRAIFTLSVLPFYGLLAAMLYAVARYVVCRTH